MNVTHIKRHFNYLSSIVLCDGTSEHMRNFRDEWNNVSIKLYDDYSSEVCNVRLRLRVGGNEILLFFFLFFFKQTVFEVFPEVCSSAFLKEVQYNHTRN